MGNRNLNVHNNLCNPTYMVSKYFTKINNKVLGNIKITSLGDAKLSEITAKSWV